jgi:mono/diheme cytochrome c family protein
MSQIWREERMRHSSSKASSFWLIVLGAIGALVTAIIISLVGVYAGLYNVAADVPHSQAVYWLLETAREQSIAKRAADIRVPRDIDSADRIASGAGQYANMCANCHLAPGMDRTEMSRGLYPRAPELHRGNHMSAAEEFWVIKHGIKATGMPAWGVTHSDDMVWDIVAFLRKLPDLSIDDYRALVEKAPSHDEIVEERTESESSGHSH